MIQTFGPRSVHIAQDPVDMRKSINGLVAVVEASFRLDPFSPSLFVFSNRQRDRIKILQWDSNGFWIHYKRLERGHFQWPKPNGDEVVSVDARQLSWLLDGLSIQQPKAHRHVAASIAV